MSNFKGTIILDADDCLIDLKYELCNAINKYTGKSISCDDWYTFNITDIYEDLKIDDFYDVIIDNQLLQNAKSLKHVKETLVELKSRGYRIVIISSRAYHPQALEVTENWFKSHGIPYDNMHISGNGIKKSYYANIYDNIVASVDDNLDNCIDFSDKCDIKNVVLMNQPWNASDTKFRRVANISEILNIL